MCRRAQDDVYMTGIDQFDGMNEEYPSSTG